jgi:hypothetical protein
MEEITPLFQMLERTRKLLEDAENSNETRKMLKLVKSLEGTVIELRRQGTEHLKFRGEYARELVELVKVQQINVGPGQTGRLQTLPYATGKERAAEERAKKIRKKRKVK